MRDWGTGGKYQQITQAITGALQGVLNGDLTQALANGSAPFLAEAIKNATTNPDGSVNTEANLAAHAILGALLSAANGNNALAGGLGALTAEAAAKLIKDQIYGDKSFADLTEAERQNISALAQIAAAVAGGLAGDSSSDAAQGAIAGKNAVENNYLFEQEASLKKLLEAKLLTGTITELEKAQLDTIHTLDEVRDALLATACQSSNSQMCLDALSKALGAKLSYEDMVEILNGGIRVPDGALSYPEDYQNVLAILNGVTSDTIKYEQSINSIMSNNPGMTRQEAQQRFDEIYNNPNAKISMVLLSVAPLLAKGALANISGIPSNGNYNIKVPIITIDKNKYPESAKHIEEAQQAGYPSILTIDRLGAAERRKAALKDTKPQTGFDRDEYPPAMFEEGGSGSSIKLINPSDNRGAGACIGAQCRKFPNGTQVIIQTTKDKK